MSKKIKVGVIFGGRSAEHEVSLVSGKSVIEGLDKRKYEVIPIGITKEGRWLIGKPLQALKSGNLKRVKIVFPPSDVKQKGLVTCKQKKEKIKIDVFFPVLHGTYGEDGTIQGLLELAGTPYVGSGVLGSALGMDKVVQKQLFQYAKITTPEFIYFTRSDWQKNYNRIKNKIKNEIGFPCFIKPVNLGSSVGISKVHNLNLIANAINLALKYDVKVIVEKSIENCQEICISVLDNEKPRVSVPGEIIPSREFYDYDAKYVDGKSKAIIPAKLPKNIIKKVQEYAKKAFILLNCSGMARADFLVKKGTYQIYLDEINTIPGFTSISMYPKLWQASGLNYSKLLDKLIGLALEKHKTKHKLLVNFRPKKKWYK
jgi:D-alanine-D-alanine ligase